MLVRAALLLLTILSSAALGESLSGVQASAPTSAPAEPLAVIALIDSGINPYHVAFRDASPRALQHPSTYVPGYPADAVALRVTLDGEPDLATTIRRDCAEWAKVRPGQLYWFPGTRIVGAIVLDPAAKPVECAPFFRVNSSGNLVGGGSHGTMTASRAAGNGYGACGECLIVMLQGARADHVLWASQQPWIDVQSNSWGPVFPVPGLAPVPTQPLLTATPSFARAVEEAAARQPAFWAAGNGALTRLGGVGHPTMLAPHATPSAIVVGGHDGGQVALWPGWNPHVVSDACASWAAHYHRNQESDDYVGGGTSAATPYVAGLAAKVVLEARRILGDGSVGVHGGALARGPAGLVASGPLADGDLTVQELRDVLFRTADARPDRAEDDGASCDSSSDAPYNTLPLAWSAVPEGPAGIPFVGYGAVTKETTAAAVAVLQGKAPAPERPDEDAWFERDAQVRRARHDAYVAMP